jgi:EAL domain-containing protein (putative c-di-GMP-specific phosphodiesterase class I)
VFFVRAIVGLCRNLGIETTAEGVETAEELALLLEEGCTHLQGYFFGRPSPADRADAFISGGPLIPSRARPLAPPSPERRLELAS